MAFLKALTVLRVESIDQSNMNIVEDAWQRARYSLAEEFQDKMRLLGEITWPDVLNYWLTHGDRAITNRETQELKLFYPTAWAQEWLRDAPDAVLYINAANGFVTSLEYFGLSVYYKAPQTPNTAG